MKELKYNQLWLDYKKNLAYKDKVYLTRLYTNYNDPIIKNCIDEITKATKEVIDQEIVITKNRDNSTLMLIVDRTLGLQNGGYKIVTDNSRISVLAKESVGILYGVFHLIRSISLNSEINSLDLTEEPSKPIRMLNHWDNMSGEVERGYSGKSFFFSNGEITITKRIKDYGRIISSVGINGISINNVNVYDAHKLITPKYLNKIAILESILSGYGIKLFISISFAAPIVTGKLKTADPLNENVIKWWEKRCSIIYKKIPNLGGFLVKADSEGREGPFTYGRTHAQGANMLGNAIKKFNGKIIWRCFVYNCQQDWRDTKTDRAKSGFDNFMPLDGKFEDNVYLQIKNGPMDFQVREPVSPLFGGLKKTNQILEVQIAQEYTGQQKHICYLIPMFKEILDFETHCDTTNHSVKNLISGIAAVTNTGDDFNWTGHDLASSNLYGFGRLTWNTQLSSDEIVKEWIGLIFGSNKEIESKLSNILLTSRETYEKYTSPLGIGWMVNPSHHYGPNVDGYEYDRWGTYHRADHLGIGVDRTEKGTGFTNQYCPVNRDIYSNIDKCPQELLLFFHYIKYDYVLKTGKTLIQHIYDSHYEGVEIVTNYKKAWEELKESIEPELFSRVMDRINLQLLSAIEWRDVVNTYFFRKSNIMDNQDRGNKQWR